MGALLTKFVADFHEAATAVHTRALPAKLIVASPLAEQAFCDLAESSGMTVNPVEVLPNLTPAIEQLVQSFANGGTGLPEGFLGEDEPTGQEGVWLPSKICAAQGDPETASRNPPAPGDASVVR